MIEDIDRKEQIRRNQKKKESEHLNKITKKKKYIELYLCTPAVREGVTSLKGKISQWLPTYNGRVYNIYLSTQVFKQVAMHLEATAAKI